MEANTQTQKKDSQDKASIIQLVVFTLGTEEYAVPISDVKEVVKTPDVTPVPNSPSFILGIINLRGNIIPVLDLQKVFSLNLPEAENQKQHILVTQTETPYGILVNKVTEVISINENDIQEAPNVSSNSISNDYVQGVAVIKEEVVKEKASEKQPEVTPVKNDDQEANQKAILILRVAKIVEAKDLIVDASANATPIENLVSAKDLVNQSTQVSAPVVTPEVVSQPTPSIPPVENSQTTIAPSIDKTPIAQDNQNDVQTIQEANHKETE